MIWLGVALAGAAGCLCRYALNLAFLRLADIVRFPWHTVTANLVGCFLFGMLWAWAEYRHWLGPELRTVVLVGFLGGFTTFSTFGFECVQLLRQGHFLAAAANVLLQNAGGVAAVWLGIQVGKS